MKHRQYIVHNQLKPYFPIDLYHKTWNIWDIVTQRTRSEFVATKISTQIGWHLSLTDGLFYQYKSNALGRLVSKTDRNGRITTYSYDTIGRLTSENWSNTTNYFMYTYDTVSNLLYATDGQHSYSYTYDSLYHPTHVSFNFDSQSAVFSYTYDAVGRQTSSSLTLNGHADRVNTTTYDYLGNATSIRQHGNAVDEIFAEFDYNANSLLTSVRRFEKDDDNTLNEIAESLYTYNANNAITSITHKKPDETQIVQHSYTYDNSNNIVEYLNSIDGQTSYDYDFLGQLIGADYANGSISDENYTYDENGNRITANGSNYTTGDNNELTSDGTWTYTYDAEGNRISKTNAANTERELYTWDHRNRLTTVTQQEWDSTEQEWVTVQTVEYAYDYNNVWIRKTVGNNSTIFIPENYQTTVQIDNGATTHHYLWTPNQQDKILADTTSAGVLWSLTDHLGTIRDILGATTTHLIYDSFGNLISGTNPLLFGYTGKAFDTDTQLQNNINRWYDALIGRWLSTDPIGFEGNDTNLYRYVKNQTTSSLDFNGNKLVNTGVKRCVAYWKDNWLFDHIPMHWFYKIGDIGFGKFEHSNCLVGAGEIHFDDNVAYPERNENNTPSGEFYSICYDVLIEEDCYRVSCIRNAIYQFAMLPSSCYFVGVNDCRTWTIAAMKYAKQNCRHMKKLTFQTFCKCTIEYNLEFTIKLED